MKIAVASGKGGTGKTTVATNLALSLGNVQLLDCDVEEPDSHIFLDVEPEKVEDVCLSVPAVDKSKCTLCKKCAEFCQYNALAVFPKHVLFFPELCHGCGGCTLVCPEDAITEEKRSIGVIEGGKVKDIDIMFYQGKVNIGEAIATPIIKALRNMIDGGKTAILDSPPGTACPVIETIRGTDYCILVTEPTPFGLHDLKLAVEVVRHLGIPFGVIVNRDGVGDERVEKYCEDEGIPVIMKIPLDENIARLYSKGIPFVLELPEWKERFLDLYDSIKKEAGK